MAARHELAIVRIADGDVRDRQYTQARTTAVRRAGPLPAPYHFWRGAAEHHDHRLAGQTRGQFVDGWKGCGTLTELHGEPRTGCLIGIDHGDGDLVAGSARGSVARRRDR